MMVYFAAAMIVATMGLSALTWFKLKGLIEERGVLRVQQVEWEQFYSLIKDAETGQRGFLITGNDTYLTPFKLAAGRLPRYLNTLMAIKAEERRELSNDELLRVAQLVDRKLEEMGKGIKARRSGGFEAAAAVINDDTGQKIMEDIRSLFEARSVRLMEAIEGISLSLERNLQWGFVSVVATSLSGLLAGTMSWLMHKRVEQHARREERLTLEKRRAEHADREKSIFLATMSHEIRTPMNAILGFGELLLDEADNDKERRYASSIVRSGNALLQIINDILDLSKIEAGMMDMNPEASDVREAAAFVQQMFSHQVEAKPVDVRVEVAEEVPASLVLDSARLRQILINLVGNALKFTDQGHVIMRFRGLCPRGVTNRFSLVVEVEDTGVGISAEKLQDIFKPFVQARQRREAEMRGTGLGLAIVKRLTELMSGQIQVESTPGTGSVFRLIFPDMEISARLPRAIEPEEPGVDFNDLEPSHILVADDNPINRELVRGFFDKTHHTISEAGDGQEAVRFVLAHRPDVVLMDIRMPVLDGRAALRRLRQQAGLELLPVIAVTASSMAGEEGALRESFNGYVRKPFSRVLLYKELAEFIPRRTESGPAAEEPSAPAPGQWRPLMAVLRQLEAVAWPEVRDGMVLSEVQDFARKLAALGAQHEHQPLRAYAAQLELQVADFALNELEKNLAQFGERISEWERRLPPVHAPQQQSESSPSDSADR